MRERRGVVGLAMTALALGAVLVACSPPERERVADLVVPVTVQPVGRGGIESIITATGTLRAGRAADVQTEIRGRLFFSGAVAPLPGGPAGGGEAAGDSGGAGDAGGAVGADGAGGAAAGNAGNATGGGDVEVLRGRPREGTRVEAGDIVARLESEEHAIGVRLESRQLAVENAQRALEEQIALYEEGLGLQTDVETARRTLIDARADLRDAQIQMHKTRVVAPISGILTDITDLTESTWVDAGTVIARVVDYGQVVVDLQVPASQSGAVEMGQRVRVTNYALPDRVFEGEIVSLNPALDEATRTFAVKAAFDNADNALRPGMFVRADVVVEARNDVLVIPSEHVLLRQNRQVVFVEEGGQAQEREIVTGLEDDVNVEILEGLEEGERLITSNYETLRSRTQVRVTGQGTATGG